MISYRSSLVVKVQVAGKLKLSGRRAKIEWQASFASFPAALVFSFPPTTLDSGRISLIFSFAQDLYHLYKSLIPVF